MKRISILLTAFLFTFTGLAQEKINWLTTSQFEKAVKKEKQNCFIFIEDDRMNENIPKERVEAMKKRMSHFLQDEELVKYVNENFICYKFNTASESLSFQGKEYNKTEERGRPSHEFTNFLIENDRNRLPAIILKDQKFNLFEYQKSLPRIEEMKVLLEAEKLKVNYIKEKLGEDHGHFRESEHMIKRQEERLKIAEGDKGGMSKSVFPARQNAKQLLKTLTYFVSGAYQKTDMQSFKKQNNKN